MSISFEWTKDLSVGEYTIDVQHQRLLSQINKILEAISSGNNTAEVNEAVEFFDNYIKEHFSYEESYVSKIKYPYIEEHIKKHQEFIETYFLFKRKLGHGVPVNELVIEIERYLGQWWLDHIGFEDRKYHIYLDQVNNKK